LKRSEEGAHAVRINGCNQRPYLLQHSSDLHGRWLAEIDRPGAPFPDERWVTAASRTDPEPCGSGEGPAFSGEFVPVKAMSALYGNFDSAAGSVRWAPTGTERLRIQRLNYFGASRFQARPWKWATWREGGYTFSSRKDVPR
jgi:hypothetical protein